MKTYQEPGRLLANLGDEFSLMLNRTGIYHSDPGKRWYLPPTGMPHPMNIEFGRLYPHREGNHEPIKPEEEDRIVDISSRFITEIRRQCREQSGWAGRVFSPHSFDVKKLVTGNGTAQGIYSKVAQRVGLTPIIYMNGKTDPFGKGNALLFDTVIRTGETALQLINGCRRHGLRVRHFATLVDLQYGGRELLKERRGKVTLYSLISRTDCKLMDYEGENPTIDLETGNKLTKYRNLPAQTTFLISTMFDNRKQLGDVLIPTRGMSLDEAVTRMIIRLHYEAATSPTINTTEVYHEGRMSPLEMRRIDTMFIPLHKIALDFFKERPPWLDNFEKSVRNNQIREGTGLSAAGCPAAREGMIKKLELAVIRSMGSNRPPYRIFL